MMKDSKAKVAMEKNLMAEVSRCHTCGKILSFTGNQLVSDNEERICGDCYQHLLYPNTGNGQGPMSD